MHSCMLAGTSRKVLAKVLAIPQYQEILSGLRSRVSGAGWVSIAREELQNAYAQPEFQ